MYICDDWYSRSGVKNYYHRFVNYGAFGRQVLYGQKPIMMNDWHILQNKTVWLEDGIHPKYKFSSTFFRRHDAELHLQDL